MADILVFSNDTIVLSGVTRLLGAAHRLIPYPVPDDGEKEVIQKIQDNACDTLIVDSSLITSGRLHITRLLESKSKLRILLLSINSNTVQIFEKHEKRCEQPGDLNSLIGSAKTGIDLPSLNLLTTS